MCVQYQISIEKKCESEMHVPQSIFHFIFSVKETPCFMFCAKNLMFDMHRWFDPQSHAGKMVEKCSYFVDVFYDLTQNAAPSQ